MKKVVCPLSVVSQFIVYNEYLSPASPTYPLLFISSSDWERR